MGNGSRREFRSLVNVCRVGVIKDFKSAHVQCANHQHIAPLV